MPRSLPDRNITVGETQVAVKTTEEADGVFVCSVTTNGRTYEKRQSLFGPEDKLENLDSMTDLELGQQMQKDLDSLRQEIAETAVRKNRVVSLSGALS